MRWLFVLPSLLVLLAPSPASAHSFGALYNLPVPFWMYLYGGVGAIVASFLVIGYFLNEKKKDTTYKTITLTKYRAIAVLSNYRAITIYKAVGVFLFLLTILAGFIGNQFPVFNINMILFWIFFTLGLTYLTAFIGNVYAFINPLKVIVEIGEKFLLRRFDGRFTYPEKLAYYPAFIFYFLFICVELFAETGPREVSIIISVYSMITFVGILLIGKEAWFTYCDVFSVFFRLIGKIAPLEYRKGVLFLRPPFTGLLKEKASSVSLLIFILFMLSSTAFDGFKPTTPYYISYVENMQFLFQPLFKRHALLTYNTVCLFLSPFLFLSLYVFLLTLAKYVTSYKQSVEVLLLQFAYSLIPIAFAYNVAHYFTIIITEGSRIGRLISDPFGLNWNLFGTANWGYIKVVDTSIVWHSQVTIILVGHIVGVYVAHLISLSVFPSHKKALLSQVPMLVLMVIYTMAGLWILSQPITNNPG